MATKVTQGNQILAGVLTTILNEIKNEFATRSNPYNKTNLNEVTFTTVGDNKNNEITITQINNALSALSSVANGVSIPT